GVQTEGGSNFIAGDTGAGTVEPTMNDLGTVPGEESLLAGWQAEDLAAAPRRGTQASVDIMTYYHRLQIEDYLEAVIADRQPLVNGQEGRKTVELFEAIYRSQRTGCKLNIPWNRED